jgi:hypothetical protein
MTFCGMGADETRLAGHGAHARSLFEAQFDKDKAVAADLAWFAKCRYEGRAELPGAGGPVSEAFRAER